MTTFGVTLARLRTARRLSQGELGRRAGMDHSYVSRLEDGSRQPSRATVMALATALELDGTDTDGLRQSAGFAPRQSAEVERFRLLPVDVQRAALALVETARRTA